MRPAILRKVSAVGLSVALGLLVALLVRPFGETKGNVLFSLTSPKAPPELRVVSLSYGSGHGITTVGVREQTIWDRCRWHLWNAMGLSFKSGTVSTLSVNFSDEEPGLGLFVSMGGFQDPIDPGKDLSVQFIDENGVHHPMRISEGVSSQDRRTHLFAWGLPGVKPPGAGSRIELVHSGSGERLAELRELRIR